MVNLGDGSSINGKKIIVYDDRGNHEHHFNFIRDFGLGNIATLDIGHGNGMDAEQLQGISLEDFDNRYLNDTFNAMAGDLMIPSMINDRSLINKQYVDTSIGEEFSEDFLPEPFIYDQVSLSNSMLVSRKDGFLDISWFDSTTFNNDFELGLTGPLSVEVDSQYSYTITNFTSSGTYALSASDSNIGLNRTGTSITLSTPSTRTSTNFTIDISVEGQTFNYPIIFIEPPQSLYNVYAGSNSHLVYKLDSDGNQVWSFTGHTANVWRVAVDQNGNVYSCGSDNTVRKISSDGNQVWSFTGHTATVVGVAVDQNGNTYSGSYDNTVRKISPTGSQIWNFAGHTDNVFSVTVDQNGNVYSCSVDGTVRKISSSGSQLWSFTGHTAAVYGVAVDQNGNVYSASQDNSVRKISSNGSQLWSFAGHTSNVFGVAVDQHGNVYSSSVDYTVRKLDSNGNQIWSFTGHTGMTLGVAVDLNGFVYSCSWDQTVRKLDSDGNQVWSFESSNAAFLYGVTVDPGLLGAGFWN